MKTRGWLIAGVITAVGVAGALLLAGNRFLIAGGSDALITVAAPTPWAQIAAVLFAGAMVGLQGVDLRGRFLLARRLLLPLAVVLVTLAGHRVVLDGARGELRDVYWLVNAKRLTFDISEGPAVSYSIEVSTYFLRLRAVDTANVTRVFLGIPPWRVVTEELEALW